MGHQKRDILSATFVTFLQVDNKNFFSISEWKYVKLVLAVVVLNTFSRFREKENN